MLQRNFNRMTCYNQGPNGITDDIMSSGSRFRVESPLFAMKSLSGPQIYVTLSVGTRGEILDLHNQLGRPGVLMIQVNGETLYSFARDLEQRALRETTFSSTRFTGLTTEDQLLQECAPGCERRFLVSCDQPF